LILLEYRLGRHSFRPSTGIRPSCPQTPLRHNTRYPGPHTSATFIGIDSFPRTQRFMAPSTTSSSSGPNPTSPASSDPTPKSDNRILIVVVILGIIGSILVAYILFVTFRLKRRQSNGEDAGPYQGTVMHHDHPAAKITPFGAISGSSGPRFGGCFCTLQYVLCLTLIYRSPPRRRYAYCPSSTGWCLALYRFTDAFHTIWCRRY